METIVSKVWRQQPELLFIPLVIFFIGVSFFFFNREREDQKPFVLATSIGFGISVAFDLLLLLIKPWGYFIGAVALIVVPIAITFAMAHFYSSFCKEENIKIDPLKITWQMPTAYLCLTSGALLVTFLEGLICIIMAAPVIWIISIITGQYYEQFILETSNNDKFMKSSIIPIVVFLTFTAQPVDSLFFTNQAMFDISSEITINAEPDEIWPYIEAYPKLPTNTGIKRPLDVLFTMGLPAPDYATIECKEPGCQRQCVFNQNVRFDEIITELEPNKVLTFDVTPVVGYQDPKTGIDIHIMPGGPYFNSVKGQYRLEYLGNGVSKLSGTSWYTLKSSLNWYFKPWADQIIRTIHLRVFEHIKATAEG